MVAPLTIVGATILYACGSAQTPLTQFGADSGSGTQSGNGSEGGASASSGSGGGPGASSSGSPTGSGSGSGGSGSATSSGSGSGATSSSSGSGGSSGAPAGSSSSSGAVAAGDGGTVTGAAVLQHHTNASRDGVYPSPAISKSVAASVKLDAAFAPPITGNVYAQPLYVPNGPGGVETFIVATESNHVTAVTPSKTPCKAAGDPCVLWDKTFGTSVPTSSLPCGNINPLGVTGTPIIDLPSRTIFFDAMTMGTPLAHLVHAISLDDGTEKAGWPVNMNTAVSGFDSSHQNQRGALALVGGVLYVPYGGHLGDCGAYHGYVVGIPIATPTTVTSWSNSTFGTMPAFKGGIWAAGGISSDGTSLYVSTGNTSTNNGTNGAGIFTAPSTWSGGEALFRFAAGPTFSNKTVDYYYPSDWATMDSADADLGGANPVPYDVGTTHYVIAVGKDAKLYLLNRDNLGGMGAEISTTTVAGGAIIGAPAVYTTAMGTYVAFRGPTRGCPTGQTGGTLGVVRIAPGAPAVAWCSSQSLGSPMVTDGGAGNVILWDANTRLYGFDGDTGMPVFNGGATTDVMASSMQYMNTPIGAGNRIAVATPNHLYLFHP